MGALQRTNTENWKQMFQEKELRSHSPNFQIHVSVSDLLYSHYEATQFFPGKEYINGIFLAVQWPTHSSLPKNVQKR
jgi:hypothetical protein